MARVNWNSTGIDLPNPGIYHVEVKSAEEKRSSNGNMMFIVKLVDIDRGHTDLIEDLIMLEGKGWRFGKEKLYALNVPTDAEEILASELIGLRAYVAIKHEPETYTNRKGEVVTTVKAKIDSQATSPWSGYWADGAKPEGYVEPSAPF